MTLENRGFLSEFVEQQRLEVRQRHRERFDLADQVSDLGQRLMPQIAAVPRSQQNLLACGYFVRGLQTLQGSVLMAERGMVVEARILLRSALETLFYLGAALKDKEFANLLDRDHVARVEKLIGAHRRLSKDGAPKKFVQEAEVSLEQIRSKLGEGQTLPIADVARRAKMMPTYEGYYRGLSTDAAHPSSLSLATIWERNPEGYIVGVLWGPEVREVSSTVQTIALVGILLVDEINLLIGDAAVERMSENLSKTCLGFLQRASG